MEKIINGAEIARQIIENIKEKTQRLDTKPGLAVIITGENPASEIYVKNKIKKAAEIGFNSVLVRLPENTSKETLLSEIDKLNKDNKINGILLQLPLPSHLNAKDFLDKILPIKDVDGFNTYNAGKLFKNETPYALPCTAKGILTLLEKAGIKIGGKLALVIGRSNIAGKPIAALLLNEDATVIQAHSKTKNLEFLARQADIIVCATGRSGYLKEDMVKSGAVIIDVGISRGKDGKITGDVDFKGVLDKASLITPVPGGVGPMTIASLMENTYNLYLMQKNMSGGGE